MVCRILQHYGAETFATFRRALESGQRDDLRRAITAVRGQGTGLSFNYLLILSGDTNAVKADRMVTRFVADALGVRNVKPELCLRLVREASAILGIEYPKLTPSLLDHRDLKVSARAGRNGAHRMLSAPRQRPTV